KQAASGPSQAAEASPQEPEPTQVIDDRLGSLPVKASDYSLTLKTILTTCAEPFTGFNLKSLV
ncbi:hypothetical protein Tco_1480203, partial [Tanacetum coccineum]